MIKNNKIGSPRNQAIACLAAWAGTGKPVQGFVDSLVHASGLSSEDRQLAVMLVMGTLRRQGSLDLLISQFSNTALNKMKPLTLAALRVGVFQICFLEKIPDAAAVNETIAALKQMRQPAWLLGFANGVLRNIVRQKDMLPKVEELGPEIDHPAWLVERWRYNFGKEQMQAICRGNRVEPQLCLNSLRMGREKLAQQLAAHGISTVPGKYAPDSLLLPNWRGAITDLPGFAEGGFQIQDQAAQLACKLLGPFHKNGRYLDGCAGLGGKTCAITAQLPAGASLTAVEPDDRRSRLLHENLKRQQMQERIHLIHGTLEAFAATHPPLFDGILLDTPCSGTGVIRRQPDIRWNRQPDDFASYQSTQLRLLQTATKLLAPGGVLVYAACSIEPEENIQVIEQVLFTNDHLMLADCRDMLPESADRFIDAHGCFAPKPTEEIDGFFAAKLIQQKQ